MKPIHAQTLDTFRAGAWQLVAMNEGGSVPAVQKTDGAISEVDLPFRPGDVTLVDAGGNALFPPVSLERATDLAERILDGDSRAATDSTSLLVIAAALIAFQVDNPSPQPDQPVDQALAAPVLAGA